MKIIVNNRIVTNIEEDYKIYLGLWFTLDVH